ncbi:DUF3034 family protein [Saccharospirillum impatiens]|uniref:DUF3034 family protein n=1 Tax=Saccharospirillum impatiens TaxID=169438 RepID=UPI000410A6B9|nr:DUF3034 family protein [Saccharospirillum impatiens]
MVNRYLSRTLMLLVVLTGLVFNPAWAGSKILATSGATQIEGAAGGGLVPWAIIGGYGSEREWGAAASVTRVGLPDFQLGTAAVHAGINNRFEVSFAQQTLQVDNLAAVLSSPLDGVIEQHVYGAKARLWGDLIYEPWPQVSLGMQHKVNLNPAAGNVLGANSDSGTDWYLSVSKLYLHALFERNLLLNGTFRYTDANETGFLGFGDGSGTDTQWMAEASAGVFLNANWAVGVEYRQKPDRLNLGESDWRDAFVAWFPSKQVTVVGAYTDLGKVALWDDQTGWYLSVQINN